MKHSQLSNFDKQRLEQLLQIAKLEDLVSFSKTYAAKNNDFSNGLMAYLENIYVDDQKTTETEYISQMESVFSETKDIGDRWHRYEVKDWDTIFGDASKILDEGEKLLELGNADTAATIALEFFKQLCDTFDLNDLYDDEFFGGSSECNQAENLLIKALGHPNISSSLKKSIAVEIANLSNNDLEDYDLVDLDDLKLHVTIFTKSSEEGLKLLDKQIDEAKGSYHEHVYVKRKIDLLRQMGNNAEAEQVEKQYIYLPEIRCDAVDRLIDGKKYAEAEQLVLAGIDLAKADERSIQADRWTKRLLEIYELQGNKERQIDVAKDLFITRKGDLEYYHKLKALIPKSEWKDILGKLIKQIDFSDHSYSEQSNIADIYVEEDDKESLYKYIIRHSDYSTRALDIYSSHVDDEHAEEMLAIYEKLLKEEASGQADVKKYPRIAYSMECMTKLKGGREAAHRLAVYFREQYRRRPSMMEAISNF